MLLGIPHLSCVGGGQHQGIWVGWFVIEPATYCGIRAFQSDIHIVIDTVCSHSYYIIMRNQFAGYCEGMSKPTRKGLGHRAVLIVFLFVASIVGLGSCSNDGIPGDVRAVWDTYVAALKSCDEDAAKALWTEESAPYCEINDTLQFQNTTFSLIKADRHRTYVRLQVLEEWGGKQASRFYYLVRQHDKYLFQYPFLMFAGDWPTVKSTHFTFHVRPSADELFAVQNDSATLLDTLPYEQFVSRLQQLTGLEVGQPIDYYLCDDTSQVSLLSGFKNAFWYSIGSCSITMRANDYSEITRVVFRRQHYPLQFLRVGLIGFGENERVLRRNTPRATISIYSKCLPYLSRLTPDTLDILINLETADPSLQARLYIMRLHIAGSLVTEMVLRDSANRFTTLYKVSRTEDDFRRLFVDLYGEQPLAVLRKLNQQYTDYINEMSPKLRNPDTGGSH
jgi:hypothetical protein